MTPIASYTPVALPVAATPPLLEGLTIKSLLHYYDTTWALSDALMGSITGIGTLYRQADPLRHPLVFYLGHTAGFYINKLEMAGVPISINAPFEKLFAVGVDPSKAEDLETPNWPCEDEVWAFRRQVYHKVRGWLLNTPIPTTIQRSSPHWAVLMGIEHHLIHFETSSVLIRQYPHDELTKPRGWPYAPPDEVAPDRRWISLPGGQVRLGKPNNLKTYGWDNEYGALSREVAPFEASNLLITNREFTSFCEADGYANPQFWSDDGWQWVKQNGINHPRFWIADEGCWRYRALFNEIDMPLDWPVEVNQFEAEAFCCFLGDGSRLPTEAEFRHMTDDMVLPQGDTVFSRAFNLNLAHGSPCTVGSMRGASTPRGITDAFGNVWQWLSDEFYPLPGFEEHPWYKDFSSPFFTADHAMLLGGSWASLGTSASRYYRLWFRRKFYQHAGFRPVRSRN